MKDVTRSMLVILVIVFIFVMSWVAFDHIDDSCVMRDNVEIEALQHENDSLQTVIFDLKSMSSDSLKVGGNDE